MRPMLRKVLSVIAGFCAWFVVATLLNLVLRAALPGYHEAELTLAFTLAMQVARLVEGAVASLAAGLLVAWMAKGQRLPVVVYGILLVLMFLPVHYQLWQKFPFWYHLTFLISLFPLTLLGALLWRPAQRPMPAQ